MINKTRTITALMLICLLLVCSFASCKKQQNEALPYWNSDSPSMASILSFVASVTDEKSEAYVSPDKRIAVFDVDGTLYGELFPTYFDETLLLHRLLHDTAYQAAPEDRAWAQAAEKALLNGQPEPDSPRSGAQMAAEAFRGFTVEEYRAYVHAFMEEPVAGFENMTYGKGFYLPMVELVKYLSSHGFIIFICTGAERSLERELIKETIGEWIPPYRVIGSTFSLVASNQGEKEGRKYTLRPDDTVLMGGNLLQKNQKMNKVISIVDEIGVPPLLVFGNSSGDLSMAEYALQNGGKAYMLLCDDTDRDYGNLETAAEFAEECRKLGFETISMRNEFETIYKKDAVKTALPAPAAFAYTHDPRKNPEAMKDVVENPDAVYGFSPDPESKRLGVYAEYDWTDPQFVVGAMKERKAYHDSMETMTEILYKMRDEGATLEEMARAVSIERNRLRLESYKDDPEGLEKLKQSNLETYGHEDGPTPDELFEKYGSWQQVLQKAFSTNMGMDACCGLYDEYYQLYIELGYVDAATN